MIRTMLNIWGCNTVHLKIWGCSAPLLMHPHGPHKMNPNFLVSPNVLKLQGQIISIFSSNFDSNIDHFCVKKVYYLRMAYVENDILILIDHFASKFLYFVLQKILYHRNLNNKRLGNYVAHLSHRNWKITEFSFSSSRASLKKGTRSQIT